MRALVAPEFEKKERFGREGRGRGDGRSATTLAPSYLSSRQRELESQEIDEKRVRTHISDEANMSSVLYELGPPADGAPRV